MAKKKRKKRKKKETVYYGEYLSWLAYYNEVWRHQFGWPKMLMDGGWQGAFFQAKAGAVELEEEFPTWDALTVGAKAGIAGWDFQMPRGTWLLEPRGTKDKNVLQMARWGRKAEANGSSGINPKFLGDE